jgi:hypothetical protein
MSLLDFGFLREAQQNARPRPHGSVTGKRVRQKRANSKRSTSIRKSIEPVDGSSAPFGPRAMEAVSGLVRIADGADETHILSESSAAMEQKQRLDRKRQKYKRPKLLPPSILTKQQAAGHRTMGSGMQQVRVLGFDDMLTEFPHMRTGLGHATSAQTVPDDEREPAQPPPIADVLRRHIAALPRPDYITSMQQGMTQEELVRQLERRVLQLPVQSATLESALLAEGGAHIMRDDAGVEHRYIYPYCIRGKECIGVVGGIDGFTTEVGCLCSSLCVSCSHVVFSCVCGRRREWCSPA